MEFLCHKLFEKKELITSGRLQLIGLGKVRQRVGEKRWAGLKNVIYGICDDTIKKYIARGDLHIRYKDESYMLVFATASPRESELKTALIAEEIRRRLFEEQGIEDVEVISQTTQLMTSRIYPHIPFPECIDIAFEESIAVQCVAKPSLKIVEVEAFSETQRVNPSLDLGLKIEAFQNVHYVPIWDQARGRLIANLCLVKGGADDGPVEAHEAFFRNLSAVEKANTDLAILAKIIGWMEENPEKLVGFGIICPVHYQTLTGAEGQERYRVLCQKINEHMKMFLLFMVLDMPPSVPWVTLSQVVSPLKAHGRILCGQVSQPDSVDFESLRLAGFDNAGFILPPSGKRINIQSFVSRARRQLMLKTFILGINDPFTASEAAAAGVSYLGGEAIHAPITNPAQKPAFQNYPFARMWQKARSRG